MDQRHRQHPEFAEPVSQFQSAPAARTADGKDKVETGEVGRRVPLQNIPMRVQAGHVWKRAGKGRVAINHRHHSAVPCENYWSQDLRVP